MTKGSYLAACWDPRNLSAIRAEGLTVRKAAAALFESLREIKIFDRSEIPVQVWYDADGSGFRKLEKDYLMSLRDGTVKDRR